MSKIFVGARAQNLDIGAEVANITRVNLVVDSDNMYTVGNDAGRTLEVECPWGTQAMANSILARVSGVNYKPFSAERALLDPAFEIGDAVTIGGVYSQIAGADCTYNGASLFGIEAPDLDEIDDEYPAQQTQQSSIKRQLAYTRSLITKTAEEIRLEVQGFDGRISALSVTLDGVTIQDENGQTRIKGSSIETGSLKVSAANITGTLTIGQMPAGVARIEDIPSDAEITIITNSAIRTATFSANQITTGTLSASVLNLDGLLSLTNYGSTYGYMGVNTAKGGPVLSDIGMNIFFVTTNNAAKMSYYEQNMIWVASGGCYSSSAMQVYSDRSMKNDISYDLSEEEKLFNSLKPCSFQMSNDPSQKKHWGFIAQEVICGAKDANMDTDKLAVIGSYEDKNTLAYSEFTAINTHMIQKLMARVAELERKVNGL